MKKFIALCRGQFFTLFCRTFRKNIIIGRGLLIFKRLRITGKGKVVIGNNCRFEGVIGDSKQYNCIDTEDANSQVVIGNNSRFVAVRIWARFSITIGEQSLIEETAIIDTDFHSIDRSRETPPSNEKAEKCKVTIGNRVGIGAQSIVAKGAKIGDNAIIGPGSMVKSSIGPGQFACGNPATIYKT